MQAPLPPDQIHLWCTRASAVDEARFSDYASLLSHEERAAEARFHFPHDRRRYRITRALLRTTLSRYLPGEPRSWRFVTNAHGRPALASNEHANASVDFNLSHADDLIVLAVGTTQVGVDTESLERSPPSHDIAAAYLSPFEIVALQGLAPADRHTRFLELWTLKESYIKALGTGLNTPLHAFGFVATEAGHVILQADAVVDTDPARWSFWQFCYAENYLIALCARRARECDMCVVAHEILPLGEPRSLELRLLRATLRSTAETP